MTILFTYDNGIYIPAKNNIKYSVSVESVTSSMNSKDRSKYFTSTHLHPTWDIKSRR